MFRVDASLLSVRSGYTPTGNAFSNTTASFSNGGTVYVEKNANNTLRLQTQFASYQVTIYECNPPPTPTPSPTNTPRPTNTPLPTTTPTPTSTPTSLPTPTATATRTPLPTPTPPPQPTQPGITLECRELTRITHLYINNPAQPYEWSIDEGEKLVVDWYANGFAFIDIFVYGEDNPRYSGTANTDESKAGSYTLLSEGFRNGYIEYGVTDVTAWIVIVVKACAEPAIIQIPTPGPIGCNRLYRGLVEEGRNYTFVAYGYVQIWSSVSFTANGQNYESGTYNIPVDGQITYRPDSSGDVDIHACGLPPTLTPTPSPCTILYDGDIGDVGVFPYDHYIDIPYRGSLNITTTNFDQGGRTYQPQLNAFLLRDEALAGHPQSTRSMGVTIGWEDTRDATRLRLQSQFARWWIRVELCPLFVLTPTATQLPYATAATFATASWQNGGSGWGGATRDNVTTNFNAQQSGRGCYVIIPGVNANIPLVNLNLSSPGLTVCVNWYRITMRVANIDIWSLILALIVGSMVAVLFYLVRRG
jgi:hypothetical protein